MNTADPNPEPKAPASVNGASRSSVRPRRWAICVAGLALALLLDGPAGAYLPGVEPVARTAAKQNRAAERSQPVRVAFEVRYAKDGKEAAPLASGHLLASPDGVAGMELVRPNGSVERQARHSGGLRATRGGSLVADPRPVLPPLWLLQSGNGSRLLGRLAELGGDPRAMALGYDGPHDCYVLGGRAGGPAVWIDLESFTVARIDVSGGVTYRFGPEKGGNSIRMPGWIEVESPGEPTFRLDLGTPSAAPADAPELSAAWLASAGAPVGDAFAFASGAPRR